VKGVVPSYTVERPRALMECLIPREQLFAVRVKYQNQVIGAGFYPHDERAMYYWDSASDAAYLHLCPNELLHWTAMKLAISCGIPAFNIGGGPLPSRFTQKFGGGVVSYNTYRKSFVPLLDTARQLHRFINAVSESLGAGSIRVRA
jgi:lipid II:glycine glycyltransferase (peptidoglycan interpeptide bridge formation enzyme)